MKRVEKTEAEWRETLTDEQFRVARLKGTEAPFSGAYHDHKGEGVYQCVACGFELFHSEAKYNSGTGWPSFYKPIEETQVELALDESHGMRRTEVMCARCGSHLGHVFDDGPDPTGKRYCINSVSLDLAEEE